MRICINWLPLDPARTRALAQAAEEAGIWGMGIGDSPHYGDVYLSCRTALDVTTGLTVGTCVTNPVTRHWSVHANAARTLVADHPGRLRLGFGRGDSAVRTFGLAAAGLSEFEAALTLLRAEVPQIPLLVAASGTKSTRMAGRVADGLIAGVGRDPVMLAAAADRAAATRPAGAPPIELWATLRFAIAADATQAQVLRRRFVPRAISAAHYTFADGFGGKDVPDEYREVIAQRLARYDYSSHGRSGQTSNAALFADHPEIERYLLDRFSIIGTPDDCRMALDALEPHVDGVYLSVLFEDAQQQVRALGEILADRS